MNIGKTIMGRLFLNKEIIIWGVKTTLLFEWIIKSAYSAPKGLGASSLKIGC